MCLLIAVVIGLAFARLASWCGASDFAAFFGGAQALTHGVNPWHNPLFGPDKPFPFNERLYYPMPTLLFLLPLAWLPAQSAVGVFVGLSSLLLAYAVLRSGNWRLLVFLSPPFLDAVSTGQWSPLTLAAMLLPGLSALWWLKPNYGLIGFLWHPRLKGALLMGAIGIAGLLLVPSWPLDWLRAATGDHEHPFPLTVGLAPLLLLALLCWRRPDARLLVALALVPHDIYWYSAVLVWLVPRSWRQSLWLFGWSWVACLYSFSLTGYRVFFAPPDVSRPLVIAGCYLPALAILLWQERAVLAAKWPRLRAQRSTMGEVPQTAGD